MKQKKRDTDFPYLFVKNDLTNKLPINSNDDP